MKDPWSTHQILAELRRVGRNVDASVIGGCIKTLINQGLVKEPKSGLYIRVEIRQPIKVEIPTFTAVAEKRDAERPAAQAEPIDRLADLSARARRLAEEVSALASDIEDVALEVEQRRIADRSDADKLRQLRDLMTSIGG